MSDLPQQLYRTKLTLLAVLFVVAGFGLLTLAHGVQRGWLTHLPVGDVGSGLFTTGLIGVALQYLDARDADQRASERLRKVIAEEAPAIRDAVIDGFAFSPDALTSVTSPELLDRVVRNCLVAQLGDPDLAASSHEQLLKEAMTPADRQTDSRLAIELTASTHKHHLKMTVRREYRFTPHVDSLRFACVESHDDFEILLRDPETAEVWRAAARDGLSPVDAATFQLASVELDGEPLELHRSVRRDMQLVTCRLPKPEPVPQPRHLAYSYEVLLPVAKRHIYYDFNRPSHGLEVDISYDHSVQDLRLIDFIGEPTDLRRASHHSDEGGDSSVATDEWVLPRAGIVAVWK